MVLYPFFFRLEVSIGLKWVPCRQHIDGSCFFIQSSTLRLLTGPFTLFMYRVTFERYECSVTFSDTIQSLNYLFSPCFVDCFFGLPLSFTGSPLLFLAELVWWSHIVSVSAYLGSSLSLLLFWMTTLLDKLFLAACSSHLVPWIYHTTSFWPAWSLWRVLLLIWYFSP